MAPTEFTNTQFDFGFVERIAVLPFENLTRDRQAGFRANRLIVTELLASGSTDVVEPGEVQTAVASLPGVDPRSFGAPNKVQILSLGETLNAQALLTGTVSQSEVLRSGAVSVPVVTINARLVETETGATVWAATHTEKGGTTSARILGAGGQAISETTRDCVTELLKTLVK